MTTLHIFAVKGKARDIFPWHIGPVQVLAAHILFIFRAVGARRVYQGTLKDTFCNHLKHVAFSTPKYRETTIYKAMFRCIM